MSSATALRTSRRSFAIKLLRISPSSPPPLPPIRIWKLLVWTAARMQSGLTGCQPHSSRMNCSSFRRSSKVTGRRSALGSGSARETDKSVAGAVPACEVSTSAPVSSSGFSGTVVAVIKWSKACFLSFDSNPPSSPAKPPSWMPVRERFAPVKTPMIHSRLENDTGPQSRPFPSTVKTIVIALPSRDGSSSTSSSLSNGRSSCETRVFRSRMPQEMVVRHS